MAKIDGLNLLDYIEDAAKADIGPKNVDHQETKKATHYHGGGPLTDLQA